MFKIFLIPECYILSEFDTGLHLDRLSEIECSIEILNQGKKSLSFSDWDRQNQLTKKIENLNKKKQEIITLAKNEIALVNSQKRADIAIKYYRNNIIDKFQRCEFEILRAKL